MSLLKPCYICGELSERARCPAHRPKHATKNPTERGYDERYRRLRDKAVAMQPWCTDCLTTGEPGNPITLDHTAAAWVKVNAGKALTLKDVADGLLIVRCLRCNIAAGNARGQRVTRD